jgi:hypothetical protein
MSALTEEEAKTKWCPFSQTPTTVIRKAADDYPADIVVGLVSSNRLNAPGEFSVECLCVASRCMAWRQTDNKTWPSAPGEPERPPEPAGYCGLSGRPA